MLDFLHVKGQNKDFNGLIYVCAASSLLSQLRHLREIGRLNAGLDDSSVDGQNGEDDAGQKHQGQLVHILDANKYDSGHGGQQDGPIHAHVI